MGTRTTWTRLLNIVLLLATATIAACGRAEGTPTLPGNPVVGALHPDALTFAQVDEGDRIATLLVVRLAPYSVEAVDLSARSGHYARDAFDVIGAMAWEELEALAISREGVREVPVQYLVGVGPRGLVQIATGTGQATIVAGDSRAATAGAPLLFPKFSQATGPAGEVATAAGMQLEAGAGICARFDREIRSLDDFDAARKGFFLCGDFTDRATLARGIDAQGQDSGDGFTDASSGVGRFPAGPLLVVPRDWRGFLATIRVRTLVDGELRQDRSAAGLSADLRDVVAAALDAGARRTWAFDGGRVPMTRRGAIDTGAAVVASESAAGRMLHAGNHVRHASNFLGWIDTRVVAAPACHTGGEPCAPSRSRS